MITILHPSFSPPMHVNNVIMVAVSTVAQCCRDNNTKSFFWSTHVNNNNSGCEELVAISSRLRLAQYHSIVVITIPNPSFVPHNINNNSGHEELAALSLQLQLGAERHHCESSSSSSSKPMYDNNMEYVEQPNNFSSIN